MSFCACAFLLLLINITAFSLLTWPSFFFLWMQDNWINRQPVLHCQLHSYLRHWWMSQRWVNAALGKLCLRQRHQIPSNLSPLVSFSPVSPFCLPFFSLSLFPDAWLAGTSSCSKRLSYFSPQKQNVAVQLQSPAAQVTACSARIVTLWLVVFFINGWFLTNLLINWKLKGRCLVLVDRLPSVTCRPKKCLWQAGDYDGYVSFLLFYFNYLDFCCLYTIHFLVFLIHQRNVKTLGY